MSTLSARQQSELQLALLDYLAASGFQETFESLKREAGQVDYVHDPKAKTANLLEKKWTSVIRLQKKARVRIALGLL
jgi:platelet-activating factor acetylhydrolase IB subunit alpha